MLRTSLIGGEILLFKSLIHFDTPQFFVIALQTFSSVLPEWRNWQTQGT